MKGLLAIGKIVKTHSLKGAVKISSYLESDSVVAKLKKIYIEMEKGPEPFCLKSVSLKKKGFLIELAGIESINAAEQLVGREVLIPSDQLDPLPEGEYYWKDLIGLAVRTEEGEDIGIIESIFPTGSNDVYVCRERNREILLPAIPEVIKSIDLKKGEMIIRLLEGL